MSFTDVPQFRKKCDEDGSMDLMNELLWRFGNTVLHAALYDHMLNVNGIDLAYDSYSDEKHETMLLIAGLGTQMIRWTVPFCEMLAAKGYRVIRFDNRDTNLSTYFSHHTALDFEALSRTLMSGQRPKIPYTLEDMSAITAV